jgi:sigma-B regulation protein RsbU (phosphoserine phosphatase)
MNFETNQLTYARAGHNPILYYRANDKEANYIEGEGLGLGIIRNRSYAKFIGVTNLRLRQDDVIVLYTDGLVEGRKNESAEEQYGYENLKNCVVQHAHLNAQEITQAIYQDFAQFTVNGDFKDDTSIMVIKIKQLTQFLGTNRL